MRCEQLMKKDVVCVRPEDSVQKASELMRDRNVGFLPVCDADGKIQGTITDRDIAIRACTQDRKPGEVRISETMSGQAVTCLPTDDLKQAEIKMGRHKISRMIVANEQGKVEGVVSLSDIAEADPPNIGKTLRNVTSRERLSA